MIRATAVRACGTFGREEEVDRVELSHDGRHRRRVAMRGAGGLGFLLDLPEAVALREGDGLVLEGGGVVRVVASAEPVVEIFGDVHLRSRVAWHLGNRHVPTEILSDRIRIGRDHVLEAMVAGLGARVVRVEAPFQPEPGAYAHGGGGAPAHGHSHGEHVHDHAGHAAQDHHHPHAHERAHGDPAGHGHAHSHGGGGDRSSDRSPRRDPRQERGANASATSDPGRGRA